MSRMQQPRWVITLLATLVALAPVTVTAHVKWFEQSDASTRPRVDWSLVLSLRTVVLLGVIAVALGGLYFLRYLVSDPHWPDFDVFQRMALGAPTLLAVQAAITLVYAAAQPAIFVPNIPLPVDAFGLAVAAVELLIAFSFITGVGDWIGALALILLWPVSLYRLRVMDTMDMLFWVGIGLMILVVGRRASDVTQERAWIRARNVLSPAQTVALLRVIAGVAIVAPALSEKIWNPALGEAFIADHPKFNFMQHLLGVEWFTDARFVLAAGVAEATIGVLLVSGLLTRVVILAMWLPFNIGIPFLPPLELIGHLPILGIMYLLLVHGAGIAPGEAGDRVVPPGSPVEQPVSTRMALPGARSTAGD